MSEPHPILGKMLERLYGALMRGPQLNCSPHRRRQRLDLTAFERFEDGSPERLLCDLLSEKGKTRVRANVPIPPQDLLDRAKKREAESLAQADSTGESSTDEKLPAEPPDPHIERWKRQQKLLLSLRHLGEDALGYAQETGVEALEVGFPLLSLPPGSLAGGTRRILAPIALIGCSMTVRTSGRAGVERRDPGFAPGPLRL